MELADTFTYLDLLATAAGIDLERAVISKFNQVSAKNNFPERIAGSAWIGGRLPSSAGWVQTGGTHNKSAARQGCRGNNRTPETG